MTATPRTVLIGLLALALAATLLLLAQRLSATAQALTAPMISATTSYVGSAQCVACHEDRHQSWHRTYHRTMTQKAGADSVLGDFDGVKRSHFGGVAAPFADADGYGLAFYEQLDATTPLATARIVKTVGSHRYQQYLAAATDDPDTLYRLPLLWHIGEQRWVHMNAAFLGDDSQAYNDQVALWNATCIHCHNTGAAPRVTNLDALTNAARSGRAVDFQTEARFDTAVSELGIACESCHGPGGEHLKRLALPLAQVVLRLVPGTNSAMVDPMQLEPDRQSAICGQCHAGRAPLNTEAAARWLAEGQSFRPGDALEPHFQLVKRSSAGPSGTDPSLFERRFWADDTPRLTAHEWTGMSQSACAIEGDLGCLSCHTMHSGDPAGMLPAANRGDAACIGCHQDIAQAGQSHTRHEPQSAGARCMSCHMPRAVYGVMGIHVSHRIEIPDASRDAHTDRPNACLNCHQDQTSHWAIEALRAWSGLARATTVEVELPQLADSVRALLGGDPVRQAVAAELAGQVADGGADRLGLVPYLIAALGDSRPAIRRFAWRSLGALDQHFAPSLELRLQPWLAKFDYQQRAAETTVLRTQIAQHYAALDKSDWPPSAKAFALRPDYSIDPQLLADLESRRAARAQAIVIGE